MHLNLSDDLRHAVETEGTPLKLVDPKTGEMYLLVRESDEAAAHLSLSNTALKEIAKRNRPPQEWLEGDEEKLF
jgi:hypothetical protein